MFETIPWVPLNIIMIIVDIELIRVVVLCLYFLRGYF